jgi:seryl-tRNA synthetase
MREFVCMGSPQQAADFRDRWMERAPEFADRLALPHRIAPASDPFFGRTAPLIAQSQIEQALKFELLIPVRSAEQPTACMSFNCHRDHFSATWGLNTAADEAAHTACVAFGMDRLALALFAAHGLDTARWPQRVRQSLGL